jgi:hypothetical protein
MFKERIVREHEVKAFEQRLKPHQVSLALSLFSLHYFLKCEEALSWVYCQFEIVFIVLFFFSLQNALMSSGMTVLQSSIVEHNMLAASKLYVSITMLLVPHFFLSAPQV